MVFCNSRSFCFVQVKVVKTTRHQWEAPQSMNVNPREVLNFCSLLCVTRTLQCYIWIPYMPTWSTHCVHLAKKKWSWPAIVWGEGHISSKGTCNRRGMAQQKALFTSWIFQEYAHKTCLVRNMCIQRKGWIIISYFY